MMFFLGLVVFDHVQHRVWIMRNVFTDGQGSLRAKYDAAVREIGALRKTLGQPVAEEKPASQTRKKSQAQTEIRIEHDAREIYFVRRTK